MTVQEGNLLVSAKGNRFQIRAAELADAETIYSMLTEAARWMENSGIKQWTERQFSLAEVQGYFSNRTPYIAFDGEVPAGMFTLQSSDPDYWKKRNDQQYYYLHRLVVRGPYRSTGLGTALLNWAVRKSAADHKRGLRLDCRASNDKLNSYYQGQGFQFQGVTEKELTLFHLYERSGNPSS